MSRPCSTDVWVELSAVHAPVLRALSLRASRQLDRLTKWQSIGKLNGVDVKVNTDAVNLVPGKDRGI